jgi:hypothetical protein
VFVAAPQPHRRVVVDRNAVHLVAVSLDAAPADAVAVEVDVADVDHAVRYTRAP